MVLRLRSFGKSAPAFAVLALLSCSEADDDNGDPWDSGTAVGPSVTDAQAYRDVMVIPGGTGADTAPATNAADCLPFSPPIPCAKGTACPGDAYCDFKQSPPICTKLHCQANGTACTTETTGNAYCMSGLCHLGVCTDPVGDGASCANQACTTGMKCLGYPPICVKPRPIGAACQGDEWCADNAALATVLSPSQVVYCLDGICGTSYCNAAGATAACGSRTCDPGYDCLGVCTRLYCGKDGIPCTSDAFCATGFGCIDGHCRKLNVAPHCTGTPNLDCSSSTLVAVPGCIVTVTNCAGTAKTCASQTSAGSKYCMAQAGCQWDESTRQCTGTATACSELTGAIGACTSAGVCPLANGCQVRNGCTPTKTITGSPTLCNQLSAADCTSQYGCKVSEVGGY